MSGLGTSTRQQLSSVENQISSNGDNEDKNCSATLVDLEALHCPICCDALTSNIFQCDNGHIACPTCCNKLRNICPYCAIPIGHIRCRAMERVIKSVIVPCPNAKLGCTKSFSYGAELTHEKRCTFSLCFCPAENCNYTGSYKDLYDHFDIHKGERKYNYKFHFGKFANIYFELTEYTSFVMNEHKDGLLFVVQCFREPHGIFVTLNCIAPSALEVGEFSCSISALGKYIMTIEFPKVKKVRKLSFQTPEEDFLLVPSYLFLSREAMKLQICVRSL